MAKPPKENGNYDIKVSGYYSGTGKAVVTPGGVMIRADLKDEAGASHRLMAVKLVRDEQRHNLFRGRGALDGMETIIDGRVDPVDKRKGEILKSGRIVFTFKVLSNGRHGRGAGENKSGPKQGDADSGPGNAGPSGGSNPAQGAQPGGGKPGNGGPGNSYGNGPGTGPGANPGNEHPGEGGNSTGKQSSNSGKPATGSANSRPQGGGPGSPRGRK